jgi:hypothetical protein
VEEEVLGDSEERIERCCGWWTRLAGIFVLISTGFKCDYFSASNERVDYDGLVRGVSTWIAFV